MEQRANGVLQPSGARQYDLRRQWARFYRQGFRAADRGEGHRRSHADGIEFLERRASDKFTCLLSFSNPALQGTPTYGTCITESDLEGIGVEPLVNPFGAEGTRPAFSPILQFNLRARYDLTINEYKTVGNGRRQPRRRHVE